MGDVIGLGRKRPNGAKIAKLRKQGGLTQDELAERTGYSERLLRDIERRNHPVLATTITDIATALQTTPDEITLSSLDGTPTSSVPRLKLTAIRSAKDLSDLASCIAHFDWKLDVDPSPVTAPIMQSLMVIIRRLVDPSWVDEFDREPFGEIPRLARLQELLTQLREQGVGVIAGKYVQYTLKKEEDAGFFSWPVPDKPEWRIQYMFILCLRLVPAEKQEVDIEINPGKSVDDLIKEAKARRPAMAGPARGDMDDEIPF
jgi:transcriptional regulator with XRE-family HTH domain